MLNQDQVPYIFSGRKKDPVDIGITKQAAEEVAAAAEDAETVSEISARRRFLQRFAVHGDHTTFAAPEALL